jgi:2-polyprenyl-6-methoxyphenol hydroxylase-like FAD-dependent oxidoreductase
MSLPENTTILIVGAGPAGLTTALSLIHHACCDFVIIDAAEGHNTSRAITMHAGTVEVR